MNVFEVIRNRRSIRSYEKKPVEKDKLMKVLEAARLAPSAANFQPWTFIVVTDHEVKESMRLGYNQDWFLSAPVIIVACAQPEKAWIKRKGLFGREEYWKLDIAVAMQNLILTAWEEGLGTCWVANFKEDEVKKALKIPQNVRVIAMTPLGYPAEQKDPVTDRKALEEIIRYEHW
jgi:nitroreductase